MLTWPYRTATHTYDPDHPTWRTKVIYDTGVEQRMSYDDGGRLTLIEGFNTNPTPEVKLTSFAYTYDDAAHNNDPAGADTALRSTVTDIHGTVTTYGYDALDRLLSADSDPTVGANTLREWTYDGVGNIGAVKLNGSTTQSFTYNDANQLTSGGAVFDANGNRTASSAYGYTAASYDAANQTTTQTPNGGTSQSMVYAGATQDHMRTLDGLQFQNSASQGITGIYGPTSGQTFTREPDGTLVNTVDPNGDVYNYLFDGQGSVVALTDDTGTVVNTYTYDPYGRRLAATENVPNPFQYISGYTNTNGQTYKFGTRWYDTTSLAWTQTDPAGQSATYTYVDGNPINRTDPGGRIPLGGWQCGIPVVSSLDSSCDDPIEPEVVDRVQGGIREVFTCANPLSKLGCGIGSFAQGVIEGDDKGSYTWHGFFWDFL